MSECTIIITFCVYKLNHAKNICSHTNTTDLNEILGEQMHLQLCSLLKRTLLENLIQFFGTFMWKAKN